MDLADLWAQHKRFILIVAGALLLLLIGRGVVQSQWDYEGVVFASARTAQGLGKSDRIGDDLVRDVQEDVDSLRERYAELVKTMRHAPGAAFQVPAGEANPRGFFFKRHRETSRALVEAAERQDIRVPEALGLKDMAPTEPEEIRRQLIALDVVQQVVIESISAGVRRIGAIQIEDDSRARGKAAGFLSEVRVRFEVIGGEKAIRSLLTAVVDGAARSSAPFLAIDQTRVKPVKGELGMLQLDLSVTALQIEKRDGEPSDFEEKP